MKNGRLLLPGQEVITGKGFGSPGSFVGELVFTTAMTGYVEALTDPSFAGQILVFAYPLIGNYGISRKWVEGKKIYAAGVIVHDLSDYCIHREQELCLADWLSADGIGGLSGVDTRMLVKQIRNQGTTPAMLEVSDEPFSTAAADNFALSSADPVLAVSRDSLGVENPLGKRTVALLDFGAKGSIVKELAKRDCRVLIFPGTTQASEILKYKPNGVMFSNGPGDPGRCTYAIECIRELFKTDLPLFGICLGHQLLALAAGAQTYKLKFGHRGLNQPVQNVLTKQSFLTSQNHGYAVIEKSIPRDWEVLFTNLNDGTIEGLRHRSRPIFSAQFHPEAHPGPGDTGFLFDTFLVSLTKNELKPAEKYQIQFAPQNNATFQIAV